MKYLSLVVVVSLAGCATGIERPPIHLSSVKSSKPAIQHEKSLVSIPYGREPVRLNKACSDGAMWQVVLSDGSVDLRCKKN